MHKIHNLFWNILYRILYFFGLRIATGEIIILSGENRTIKVFTEFSPKRVWISLCNDQHVPSCGYLQDCFDFYVVNDGFVISTNIKSEYKIFSWIAIG